MVTPTPDAPEDLRAAVTALQAQNAALSQLLEVYEATAVDQAYRLEEALSRLEEQSRRVLEAERDRAEQLQRELDLARRVQTSILPRAPAVRGLEIAAAMIPATEVGGDYYDVIPVHDGCWIGIGDVTGHGLDAGLVMLMTQSIAAALCTSASRSPRDILSDLNRVLFENIRKRMDRDDHVTFSLIRYHDDGGVTFAGAHEDIVVCRARDGAIECIPTPGCWLGAVRDVSAAMVDTGLQLAEGDTMLLYTDGMTEARNANRQQYGLDRMCEELRRVRTAAVEQIRDHLLQSVTAWADPQFDDATLIVLRQSRPTAT
jgi:sigma-B regulation protein RsbU (phosphoserine phosphatase)